MKKYLLKKDIVIPAGTIFMEPHAITRRYGKGCIASFGLTNDTCGDIEYHIDDDISEWFEEIGPNELVVLTPCHCGGPRLSMINSDQLPQRRYTKCASCGEVHEDQE